MDGNVVGSAEFAIGVFIKWLLDRFRVNLSLAVFFWVPFCWPPGKGVSAQQVFCEREGDNRGGAARRPIEASACASVLRLTGPYGGMTREMTSRTTRLSVSKTSRAPGRTVTGSCSDTERQSSAHRVTHFARTSGCRLSRRTDIAQSPSVSLCAGNSRPHARSSITPWRPRLSP